MKKYILTFVPDDIENERDDRKWFNVVGIYSSKNRAARAIGKIERTFNDSGTLYLGTIKENKTYF